MTDNHQTDGVTPDRDPLASAVDALRSRTGPTGPTDDLVRRTAACMVSIDVEQPLTSAALASQQSRSRRVRRYVMRSLSTAACLVVAAAIYVAATGTSTAFAAVHQQIQEAKTLAYTSFVHSALTNAVIETQVRVNADGRERQELSIGPTKVVTIVDPAAGRTLSLDAMRKTATALTFDRQKGAQSSAEWIGAFRKGPAEDKEKLPQRTIDGVKVDGYRMAEGGFTFDVWIDATTEELIEIEYRADALAELVTKVVMRDFVFNEPIDEALFSLDVPEGYRAMSATLPKVETDGFVSVQKALAGYSERANGEFPDSLTNWGTVFAKLLTPKEGAALNEDAIREATAVGVYFGGALPYLTGLGEKNYAYLGKGRAVNDGQGIVFWARDAEGKIKAILDDLSVREVADEELPQ